MQDASTALAMLMLAGTGDPSHAMYPVYEQYFTGSTTSAVGGPGTGTGGSDVNGTASASAAAAMRAAVLTALVQDSNQCDTGTYFSNCRPTPSRSFVNRSLPVTGKRQLFDELCRIRWSSLLDMREGVLPT
jgi:hypothetical protein